MKQEALEARRSAQRLQPTTLQHPQIRCTLPLPEPPPPDESKDKDTINSLEKPRRIVSSTKAEITPRVPVAKEPALPQYHVQWAVQRQEWLQVASANDGIVQGPGTEFSLHTAVLKIT